MRLHSGIQRPACAKLERSLQRSQCEEGWHLAGEPVVTQNEWNGEQTWWVERQTRITAERDALTSSARSMRELMDRMGHSSPRAAMGYLHARDNRAQYLADALGERAAQELEEWRKAQEKTAEEDDGEVPLIAVAIECQATQGRQ